MIEPHYATSGGANREEGKDGPAPSLWARWLAATLASLHQAAGRFEALSRRHSPLAAALGVGTLAVAVSFFLHAPMLWGWNDAFFAAGRSRDFLVLCADPLSRELQEPIVAYRIVVPVLCHLLGLTGYICFVPQFLANIGTHAAVYVAVSRRQGPSVALAATLLLATSSVAIYSNIWMGVPDSVTLLCAAALLLGADARWGWILVALGALNDERMLLSLPFIAGWWHFHEPDGRWARGLVVSTGLGLVVWAALRLALRDGWIGPGIVRPQVYSDFWNLFREFKPTTHSWPFFFANVFLGYRWLWLCLAVFCLKAAWPAHKKRPPLSPGLVAVIFLAALGAAVLVLTGAGDVTRGTAFFFPALLLAVAWALGPAGRVPPRWLLMMAIAQLLTPAFFFGTNAVLQISYPLPLTLLRLLLGP